MGALGYLFWLWVIGSLIAFVFVRRNRKAGERSTASPGASGGPVEGSMASLLDPRNAASRAKPTPVVAATPAPTTPVVTEGPASAVATPAEAQTSATSWSDHADAESERSGLFATAPEAPRSSTIVEALSGVHWPCGLVPIPDLDNPARAERFVTFTTDEAKAPEVGRAVGDALEAAGFRLRSLTDTVLLAERGGDKVELTLHPRAANITTAGQRRFPTLPDDDVVLECEHR